MGVLHGVATCISRAWSKNEMSMPSVVAWVITFGFINFSWIPFRAKTFDDTIDMLKTMLGLNGFGGFTDSFFAKSFKFETMDIIAKAYNIPLTNAMWCLITIAAALIFISVKNSNEMAGYDKNGSAVINFAYVIISGVAFAMAIIGMLGGVSASQFIYSAF